LQQIAAEHRWIVAVDRTPEAQLDILLDRVALERLANTSAQIARHIQLQHRSHPLKFFEQIVVVLRAESVAQSLHAHVDSIPDLQGAINLTCGFSTMSSQPETILRGFAKDIIKEPTRPTDLVTTNAIQSTSEVKDVILQARRSSMRVKTAINAQE
jgi:hypothetical protein